MAPHVRSNVTLARVAAAARGSPRCSRTVNASFGRGRGRLAAVFTGRERLRRAWAMLRYVFHDHEEVSADVDNHAGALTAPRSARHVWSGDGVLDRG